MSVRGNGHFEVYELGQTIDADHHSEQMEQTTANQALVQMYSAIVIRKGVILQHNSATPHCAERALRKINDSRWEVPPHLPYSPYPAPSGYHLLRSLLHFVSGKKGNLEDVQKAMSRYFTKKPEHFHCLFINKLLTR